MDQKDRKRLSVNLNKKFHLMVSCFFVWFSTTVVWLCNVLILVFIRLCIACFHILLLVAHRTSSPENLLLECIAFNRKEGKLDQSWLNPGHIPYTSTLLSNYITAKGCFKNTRITLAILILQHFLLITIQSVFIRTQAQSVRTLLKLREFIIILIIVIVINNNNREGQEMCFPSDNCLVPGVCHLARADQNGARGQCCSKFNRKKNFNASWVLLISTTDSFRTTPGCCSYACPHLCVPSSHGPRRPGWTSTQSWPSFPPRLFCGCQRQAPVPCQSRCSRRLAWGHPSPLFI